MSISVAMLSMAAAERFTFDNEHTSTITTEGENEYTAPCKEDPRHMLEILLEHVVLLDNTTSSRLIAKIAWKRESDQPTWLPTSLHWKK